MMKHLFFQLMKSTAAFLSVIVLLVSLSQAAESKSGQNTEQNYRHQNIVNQKEASSLEEGISEEEMERRVVELDLKKAVKFTLQWNREVAIAGYNPKIAKEDLQAANSVYDFALFSKGGAVRVNRPTQTLLDTGSEDIDALIEDRLLAQVGIKKHFLTGGTISFYQELDFLNSNSEFVTPNSQNTSRLKTLISQPLLKNIGDQENRAKIETATANISVSSQEERQQIINVIYNVINAYWQVHLERSLFVLNQKNLQMAETILQREKDRFAQDISKQLDVDRALSAVENRRSRRIRNENRLQLEVNQLKLLLNSPLLPLSAPVMDMVPIEIPELELPAISLSKILAEGLQNRPEIIITKNKLNVAEINKKLADHMCLPTLDASVDYTLNSLGTNVQEALHNVYGDNRESWSVWLDFEYPIGNKGADAEYRKAQFEYQQAREGFQHTQEVVQKEIRSSVQDVILSNQQIDATLEAQQAAKRVLNSEMARYELARTSNKDLLQAQDIQAAAEREHLRSVVYYNLKLAQLYRSNGSLLEMIKSKL